MAKLTIAFIILSLGFLQGCSTPCKVNNGAGDIVTPQPEVDADFQSGKKYVQEATKVIKNDKEEYLRLTNLALQSFLAALEKSPDDGKTLFEVAAQYFNLKKSEKSIEYYRKAVPRLKAEGNQKTHVKAMVYLAGTLMLTGEKAEARKLCNEALVIDPDHQMAKGIKKACDE